MKIDKFRASTTFDSDYFRSFIPTTKQLEEANKRMQERADAMAKMQKSLIQVEQRCVTKFKARYLKRKPRFTCEILGED